MENLETEKDEMLISLTSEIVTSHVANNSVSVEDVPALIRNVYGALASLGEVETVEARPEPSVSVRASVKNHELTCLDCGKKVKMLKRHLMTEHDMTPEDYRERWGLSADYPMVAPDYAEKRRELAKKIGLGRKPGQRRGRRKKAA